MTGIIHRYRTYLDMENIEPVTLGEGNTPLIPWAVWGKSHIYIKFEGSNPTGSFKDRGMSVAVSRAKHEGARAVICASTGNTAASAAAYAGRAGVKAFVVIPDGQVAPAKMIQAAAYGATMLLVEGNFDQALMAVRTISAQYDWLALVNSVNPWRIRGQETGAYEIVDTLEGVPDAFFIPVGNAGNISAYYQGFMRYRSRAPIMIGAQASGANPLVCGHEIDNPQTIASAIRIGRPASAHLAKTAVSETQGRFLSVTDKEILNAQKTLAHGGIFVEPASAASYAAVLQQHEMGLLPAGDVVVVVTGSGLKDSETPKQWIESVAIKTTPDTIGHAIREIMD